ncbi:MAG: L-threonylcarbamoyladenylate synthase [bacterium]|nr:L-threonylcarbamoyladenylate synthase [bacterium]
MKIIQIDLNKDYGEAIEAACRVLRLGGVVVYPTDTVYGLGANACDILAVEQVFKIKNRPYHKPLPVIVRNLEWVEAVVYIDQRNKKVVESIWPGTTTAILPKREHLSSLVAAGGMTVGIRIPDFVFTDRLLGKFGYPLTATSANISGEEATGDINQIISRFENAKYKPTLIIDAGILPKSKPSTVLDLVSEEPKILRVGPSRPDQLRKLLENM